MIQSTLRAVCLSLVLLMPASLFGQDTEKLAKQLSNPVADLISVPFQSNFDFRIGPKEEGFRYTMNIQPVIPIGLNRNWNLITRTILPVIYQNDIFPEAGDQFGLGDTLASLFLSPVKSDVIWGVGPVFLLPTGTDDQLGGEKWGVGPTAVVLKQSGPWTYGMLANHVWSFAGADDRADVNSTFLQPFLAYTTKTALTINLNTESTYNWEDSQWTVPLQFQVTQVIRIGKLPVSIGVAVRYWADGPDSAPEWGIRVPITFLFPR